MAALTTERKKTVKRAGTQFREPLAAVKAIQGGIAVISTATGYAAPATTAATLVARGVFQETVDNSAGAAGDKYADIEAGVWGPFENSSAADLIARDDIGKNCYLVDDQTVALTSNSSARSLAGRIVDVDSNGGVFVALGIP